MAFCFAAPASAVAPNAPVPMGTALWWACVDPASADMGSPACPRPVTPFYESTFLSNFQWFTPENEFKMVYLQPKEGQWDFRVADRIARFARDHGKHIRGHTLIFGMQNPNWLTQARLVPRRRADWIKVEADHVRNVMQHFGSLYPGVVSEWDVVNEAFDDSGRLIRNPWSQNIGPDYIEQAFRFARAADRNVKLYFNETGIEHPGAKQDAVVRMVTDFRHRGVPIDGVGVQMHTRTGGKAPTQQELDALFARFAALGVDVSITEMDVPITASLPDTDPVTEQEEIYTRVAQTCREFANCSSFTTWGVADPYSWRGGGLHPLLFDDGFVAKPAGQVVTGVLRKSLKSLQRTANAPLAVILHLHQLRPELGCRGLRVRVGGADFPRVVEAQYYLGRKLVARVGAAPFASRIRGRAIRRAKSRHLRARVLLKDGRTATLTRRLDRCR